LFSGDEESIGEEKKRIHFLAVKRNVRSFYEAIFSRKTRRAICA